jgi:arsenate reductase
LLKEHNAEFTYREYTRDPLSEDEIRDLLAKLGMGPREVLRKRDAVKHDIEDSLDDDGLIAAMAEYPRLMQRPIAVLGDRAVLARPVDNLLQLL